MKVFFNKLNKKSFFIGIKKGYSLNLLPSQINCVYNHLYFRIVRFIGGVSLILLLTKNHLLFPVYVQTIITILGVLQSIQILIIFTIKFIYGIYTLRYNKKVFEVRNSPLDQYATHIARILFCAKVGCAITGGAAATIAIAAGASFDSVLEAASRPN